jgi:hypothetical protein
MFGGIKGIFYAICGICVALIGLSVFAPDSIAVFTVAIDAIFAPFLTLMNITREMMLGIMGFLSLLIGGLADPTGDFDTRNKLPNNSTGTNSNTYYDPASGIYYGIVDGKRTYRVTPD